MGISELQKQEAQRIVKENINLFEALSGKTILITGATGLLGQNLVSAVLEANRQLDSVIKLILLIRNEKKAKNLFGISPEITYIVSEIQQKVQIEEKIDYIIHAASQTSSRLFVEEPVETIMTAFMGTKNMLDLAAEKSVKDFIYLSTMEVYGNPTTEEKIAEDHGTNLDVMKARSCYPESKRMCENLCVSYMKEYGIPVKIIRLTQTFGPGVTYDDGRVFAEFARCAIEKRNIVLKTKGETKRNYLYTADAVSAIFTVLLNGKSGEAYNAANEETYCSIYEMAQMVADTCGNEQISVEIEEQDSVEKLGYAPTLKMNLDTSKLRAIGWNPGTKLEEMFKMLIKDMERR